jgi:hypothetical protein
VRLRHSTTVLTALGLVIGLNGGCLSLSMLNREDATTKQRLDALEHRVSALETGSPCRSGEPIVVPAPAPQYGAPQYPHGR